MGGSPRVFLHYKGEYLHLPDGVTTIGRDIDCRLRFNDPAVSRRHFEIRVDDGKAEIEDLGSTNGTKVNRKPVAETTALKHRDRIQVGGRELTVYFLDESDVGGEQTSTVVTVPSSSSQKRNTPRRIKLEATAATRRHTCPQCGTGVDVNDAACRACGNSLLDFEVSAETRVGAVAVDRRRHPRKVVEIPVLYTSDSLEVQSMAKNLSLSGVFISSEFLDPVGAGCKVIVMVDGGPAVEIEGRVARVVQAGHPEGVPAGLGIEFESMDAKAREWLWRTLKRQLGDVSIR